MKYIALITVFSFVIGCHGQNDIYRPKNLRKITADELIARARKRSVFNIDKITIKDSLGNEIKKEETAKLDHNLFFADYYADRNGDIVEVVIRKATQPDRELIKRINEAMEEGEEIVLVDIPCDNARFVLEQIHDIDQQNRTNNKEIDPNIDRDNQSRVVSIIEKCGFPTKEKVGQKGMESVFLVIQHGTKKLRAKYFSFIKMSAEKGELNLGAVALMEDRMLMENGVKQKYGSQVVKNVSGRWTLYPIEDPQNVNKRRASMGLNTIEEYLKNFDIEYDPNIE